MEPRGLEPLTPCLQSGGGGLAERRPRLGQPQVAASRTGKPRVCCCSFMLQVRFPARMRYGCVTVSPLTLACSMIAFVASVRRFSSASWATRLPRLLRAANITPVYLSSSLMKCAHTNLAAGESQRRTHSQGEPVAGTRTLAGPACTRWSVWSTARHAAGR